MGKFMMIVEFAAISLGLVILALSWLKAKALWAKENVVDFASEMRAVKWVKEGVHDKMEYSKLAAEDFMIRNKGNDTDLLKNLKKKVITPDEVINN